jgi:hypothetical protein
MFCISRVSSLSIKGCQNIAMSKSINTFYAYEERKIKTSFPCPYKGKIATILEMQEESQRNLSNITSDKFPYWEHACTSADLAKRQAYI